MRGKPDVRSGATTIDPSELAAILAEVRRAILAVDADTGEHRPLRDLAITFSSADTADNVVGR
ncbi:MAG TPA: hypothetical protein VD866_30240 [Urbifossiella sp.]|nr:hypothetical protein [Urbifossiella sp.]